MAPSPYRVAVGILLRFYVSGRPFEAVALERGPFTDQICAALGALADAEAERNPTDEAVFILEQIERMSHVREKSFLELLEESRKACGHLWAEYLQLCMAAIESPDDLVTLISLLKELKAPPALPRADGTTVRPTHLEPDSFFGIYIRQLVLEFHNVVFEGMSNLVSDLQAWVDLTADEFEGENDFGQLYAPQEGRGDSMCGASARMAQEYVQQRVLDLDYDLGRRSYEETEAEVQQLLRDHPDLPRAHFLRYLNSSHHGEFTGALDAVHRYFDYSMRRGGPHALNKGGTRKMVQYATLNLAALHYRFGHSDLAMTALKETIRIAQQNGDHTCVALALAWMHQLLAKTGDMQTEEVLFRCMARAGEQKLRHLKSVAALSLASFEAIGNARFHQQAITQGNEPPVAEPNALPSTRPRRVWDALRLSVPTEQPTPAPQPTGTFGPQANQANVAGSLTTALQSRDAFPLPLHEAFRLSARRCLVGAGAWEVLGHVEMVQLQCRKLLYCYGAEASSMDTSLAVVKLAMARLRGLPHNNRAEDVGCVYASALKALCGLKEHFPVPVANLWSHATALLLHEWALQRGEVQRASELCLLLRGVSPEESSLGAEAYVEAQLQWGHSLLATGSAHECVQATEKLADYCERKGMPWHYIRCLLQLAQAHLDACPADPTTALPALLRCISFCESFDVDVLHAMAFLLLAQVHLRLQSVGRARAMVKAALPVLLEHAPLRTQGEAWLTLAKCHLHEASSAVKKSGQEQTTDAGALVHICTLLRRAITAFTQCQDVKQLRESYYLQSRLHHRLSQLPPSLLSPLGSAPCDHVAERDRAASAFHRCSSFLASAQQRGSGSDGQTPRPFGDVLNDLEALRALSSDQLNLNLELQSQ